jgi:DNA-binding transcriptional ArsR family regulator
MNQPDFAFVAALAGEPARAAMLAVLFDGRAIPAGQLAKAAGVSAATASAHLSKLVNGGLVRVRSQGRHRYYELARPEIAQVLESLGSIARPAPVRSLSDSLRMQRLRFARSCYNHLAGELGIALAEALVRHGVLQPDEEGFRLGGAAPTLLLQAGVDTKQIFHDPHPHVRTCIDWTERRPHVAGPLGAALLNAFLATGVLRRRTEPRALDLTESGRELFAQLFGIVLSSAASAEARSA